ncbi:MAG TPA: ABC transporter ATP-binding protein [Anaerolineae bacterium]|nr:ABC transporter ATP-binding protein [Anaerolineae bacterium]
MSAVPILKVEQLNKRFGGVGAVYNVSFELEEGGALGVIGPNGSGKTTLVNLITGFVRPTSGRVLLKGKDITRLMPHERVGLGIARSFQMVRPFYNLPAFKNLIIPLYSPRVRRMKGGQYGNRDEVAIHLLEEVGFERDSQVPYKTASNLPHGYLKRLELARCLALEPEVLILDELFSGMSLSEVASLLPLIEKIRERGTTLMMVEHRLRELFRIVKTVIVLNFGEKIAEGTPSEVIEMEDVRKAYLGTGVGADA